MTRNLFRHGIALALVLAAGASFADTLPPARVAERMAVSSVESTKNDVMTRDEFMAMAGQMFDMAVRDGHAHDGRVTATQLLMYRRALPSQ